MTDKTEAEENHYKHLTDGDLGDLLGGYRVIKFQDDPERFNGVDVPAGLELVYEIQRRLKKSKVPRKLIATGEEVYGLPLTLDTDILLTDQKTLIKQFEVMLYGLMLYKTYPDWWPERTSALEEFVGMLGNHATLFESGDRDPKDYAFYFPTKPNKVLDKINEERAQNGGSVKFFFIGLKAEKTELLE